MADDAFLIHAYNFFGGFSLQVLLSLFWKDFFYYCMQGVQKKRTTWFIYVSGEVECSSQFPRKTCNPINSKSKLVSNAKWLEKTVPFFVSAKLAVLEIIDHSSMNIMQLCLEQKIPFFRLEFWRFLHFNFKPSFSFCANC